jgi:hypothetical protein
VDMLQQGIQVNTAGNGERPTLRNERREARSHHRRICGYQDPHYPTTDSIAE